MHSRSPATEDAPQIGPIDTDGTDRLRFAAEELAIVLSHYNLGVIKAIREYPRGSRQAPKVRIRSINGEFLLKRRAPGRDDPYRVAFAHELQQHLAERDYPIAALVGTQRSGNTLVRYNRHVYELFAYVFGKHFDQSPSQAEQSGESLGAMHRLLADCSPKYPAPEGTFHDAAGIDATIDRLPDAVSRAEPTLDRATLERLCQRLHDLYREAADTVNAAGWSDWPNVIIHGDWHPGNLLYDKGRVVAVLDFDSARYSPRMLDLANAALQFSIRMDGIENLDTWPEGLDMNLLKRLVHGYARGSQEIVGREELATLPWLVIEALIVESVVPIAATGSFARIPGSTFLRMVERKIDWLRPRTRTLASFLEEAAQT